MGRAGSIPKLHFLSHFYFSAPLQWCLRFTLTTTPESKCGYIFGFQGREWRSNQYPNLTLADAGVTKTGRIEMYWNKVIKLP